MVAFILLWEKLLNQKNFSKMKKNNICIFSQNLSPKSFSWKIDKRSEINKGKFIKKIGKGIFTKK